jgi:glycerophosphoryl diester phosphodiesterase
MIPGAKRLAKLGVSEPSRALGPLSIAHRGASAYAADNSESSFRKAAELDADMWEIDIRMSADGICVVSHDADTGVDPGKNFPIAASTWTELSEEVSSNGRSLLTLERVIELASELKRGLYLEIKQSGSEIETWRLLEKHNFRNAVIGSFIPSVVQKLRQAGCDFPLSILVRAGHDPFIAADESGADIIHLCWLEASDTPHELVTDELVAEAWRRDLAIIIWHEERRNVLDGLDHRPVFAICSDRPETLKPYRPDAEQPYRIVCHRGANHFAPENTLESAHMCFGQRLDFVELDVRTTLDGELVVIHDATVDRTTNGSGPVAAMTLPELRSLDAGSWFDPHFADARIPTLAEMLDLSATSSGGLYIELKAAEPYAVLEAVRAADMLGRCFFGCTDPAVMRALRALSADAILMARRCDFESLEAAIADCNSQIIELDVNQDDLGEIEACRRLGVATMIYDQTHQIEQLEALAALSPDYVNLDRPDMFKKIANARAAAGR